MTNFLWARRDTVMFFPQGLILLPAHFHMCHHTNLPILRKLPPGRICGCVSHLSSWEVQHKPGRKIMSETHPFLQRINLYIHKQHENSLLRWDTSADHQYDFAKKEPVGEDCIVPMITYMKEDRRELNLWDAGSFGPCFYDEHLQSATEIFKMNIEI